MSQKKIDELKSILSGFGGYVLACRRTNQHEYMCKLADWLTKVSKALGDNVTYRYDGDCVTKAHSETHEESRGAHMKHCNEKQLKKDLVECLETIDAEAKVLAQEIAFCREHNFHIEAKFKQERMNGLMDAYIKINNKVLGRYF